MKLSQRSKERARIVPRIEISAAEIEADLNYPAGRRHAPEAATERRGRRRR